MPPWGILSNEILSDIHMTQTFRDRASPHPSPTQLLRSQGGHGGLKKHDEGEVIIFTRVSARESRQTTF